MRTEDLYKEKKDCCGCELCAHLCPRGVIQMEEDQEGFLYPKIISASTCINCNKCIRICPMKSPGRPGNRIESSFCYSLSNESDLKKSASGGLATGICREFINRGGVVYGVTYLHDFMEVTYKKAKSLDELESFRGSKYVQARKRDVYSLVKNDLHENKDVLFIGLPCEVSALYHAVGKNIEHLYTISLICHGPTSLKVHRDYCNSIIEQYDAKMSFFSVRYKNNGWKPYYVHAEFENGKKYNEVWNKSDYGVAFLYLKRPSCSSCQYKAEDIEFGLQSDLTIGDFHGVHIQSQQYYNPWGVSQGSIQTGKGKYLASLIGNEYLSREIPYSVIKLSNRGLFVAIPQRWNRNIFVKDYLEKNLHCAAHSNMVKLTDTGLKIKDQLLRIRSIRRKIHGFLLIIKNTFSK